VERAGDRAIAVQLADIADVDELHALVAHKRYGVLRRERRFLGRGLGNQLLDPLFYAHVRYSLPDGIAPPYPLPINMLFKS
jgi:hypothetical protein